MFNAIEDIPTKELTRLEALIAEGHTDPLTAWTGNV
jgi:hypothetical protein